MVGLLLSTYFLCGTSLHVFAESESPPEPILIAPMDTLDTKGSLNSNEPNVPQSKLGPKKRLSLPEKLDPRGTTQEIPVRDQVGGLCWAYSSTDIITSNYKKQTGTEQILSPNFYNFYSAENAFSDGMNPNTIILQKTEDKIIHRTLKQWRISLLSSFPKYIRQSWHNRDGLCNAYYCEPKPTFIKRKL